MTTTGPILLVAGARPNFMKVAPVICALKARGETPILVHTGQHYDDSMSGNFFEDLGIPKPDYNLGVGSASHARQTARIMESFEPVLLETRPRWVVVVGDVNSTLACSLVVAKLREESKSQLAHVEAGLRSRDWRMPEEVNRVVTDRLSDLLFTPSRDALPNLLAEGIEAQKIVFVGNVMIDTLLAQLPAARALGLPASSQLTPGHFALATLHRPSNVDSAAALTEVLEALAQIAKEIPVVLPVHPRTRESIEKFGLERHLGALRILEPLGYREMLALTDSSAVVLTDSGGLQEETTYLGIPCVTLREHTERPVTIAEGTNRMAPWPPSKNGIVASFHAALAQGKRPADTKPPEGWDGKASQRIAEALLSGLR